MQPAQCRPCRGPGRLLDPPAREEFDSEEGKALLKQWGIEGDYEGIGHCILGYRSGELQSAAERKADYVIRVK